METISNAVHAASAALWGEDSSSQHEQTLDQHGDEPMSGVQGKGNGIDPFDGGNREGKSLAHLDRIKFRYSAFYVVTLSCADQATASSLSLDWRERSSVYQSGGSLINPPANVPCFLRLFNL